VANEWVTDQQSSDGRDAGAAPPSTVIAGVVATAAGATAVPQTLSLFANIAQVALLARSDLVLVANIATAALGLIALFGPGHSRFRASRPRLLVTATAVLVCITFAGLGLYERLNDDRIRPVSGSITCVPASCSTSNRQLSLSGEFHGNLADGHRLMVFLEESGRHFPYPVRSEDDRWAATAYVGSDTGRENSYTYRGCLYDIDRFLAADLRARGEAQLRQGLAEPPTSQAASVVVCRELFWTRPAAR
jgi:hypothetical protein